MVIRNKTNFLEPQYPNYQEAPRNFYSEKVFNSNISNNAIFNFNNYNNTNQFLFSNPNLPNVNLPYFNSNNSLAQSNFNYADYQINDRQPNFNNSHLKRIPSLKAMNNDIHESKLINPKCEIHQKYMRNLLSQ